MPAPHEQYRSDTSESDEGFDISFGDSKLHSEKPKIFNDMVHPHLELPGICVKIMNTPQFLRLRNLKQLGLCYFVYPSAAHNRFEHCVGTSYLAGKYAKMLKTEQPELGITHEDVTCLYVAGLIHDLGHGPFSHTWEKFIHDMGHADYHHEDMSLRMFDFLIEDNIPVKEAFEAENLTKKDMDFIKELILGSPLPGNSEFLGRKPCKWFLYEIVANGKTKIDVDKFDYLLRDCKQLNVTTVFDYQRLLDNTYVVGLEKNGAVCDTIRENTPTTIVYRKKISDTLEDLFRSRFSMHQKAYQHRVTKTIEEMVLDGLKEADAHFKVHGKDGQEYTLSTAYKDPSAFMKLTDSVLEFVLNWNQGGPKAAAIFDHVVRRKLYKFLGGFSCNVEKSVQDELQKKDPYIRFITTKINYGCKDKNPLNEVLFYEKVNPTKLVTKTFPDSPMESRTFIVYTDLGLDDVTNGQNNAVSIEADVKLQAVRKELKTWCEKHSITLEFE